MSRATPPPGFVRGFARGIGGLAWLARRPTAWPFAMIPMLVLTALMAATCIAAVTWLGPAIDRALPSGEVWYLKFAVAAASYIAVAIAVLAGAIAAFALAGPLSAPALEKLVSMSEAELRIPQRKPLGFIAETWCGIRTTALAFALTAPLLLALFVVELVLPPAVVVTGPLTLLVSSLFVAYGLFDYPLSLRGIRARRRLLILGTAPAALLGFGVACSLLFWFPCMGIVLLPAGVVGGTELLWEIIASKPELGRELGLHG
jgi:uncharacterized protein involved in cysteine biosynthesis